MTMKYKASKVALVSGASSGIGQATAELLARTGYKAYGTSRRGGDASGRLSEMLPLDVTSDNSVDAAVANFFGIVRMTRAVVPHMRRQGAGRIINIGSVLGFLPMPYMALYSATKHAVAGYTESLDHELRTQGIRACVVAPASVLDAGVRKDLSLEA